MGLDMYAYIINADLVEGQPDTDVPVHKIARQATGFQQKDRAEVDAMGEDERTEYWAACSAALTVAKASGVFNPDFAYWRKFNALHGFMEDLYRKKGGTDEQFNCNTVRITSEDLDELERVALDGQLKPRAGFFWGDQSVYPEDIADLTNFLVNARAAIRDGMAVYYDSWW